MPIDQHRMRSSYTSRPAAAGKISGDGVALWPHVFLALYGAGWAVSADVGVRIYYAEVIAAVGLLMMPWPAAIARFPMLRLILAAYGLWVFAISLSDLYNGTAIFDWARNIATPLIGAMSLVVVVAALMRNPWALVSFLAATVVAKGILGEASYGTAFADQSLSLATLKANTNFFKVRIEPALSPLIILLGCWLGRRNLMPAAILFVFTSVGYFLLDARSIGLVFFSAAGMLAGIQRGIRMRKGEFAVLALLFSIMSYSGYVAYVSYTLAYNPFGHTGKQLSRIENPYNPASMFAVGRSEWTVIPTAIAERPLLGWGSWAQDTGFRFNSLKLAQTRQAMETSVVQGGRVYIPAHSLVGSAWLWSGVLAFVAVMMLLYAIVRLGRLLPRSRSPLLPAACFLLLLLLWHYFFSPPMAVRLFFPLGLATLLVLTRGAELQVGSGASRRLLLPAPMIGASR